MQIGERNREKKMINVPQRGTEELIIETVIETVKHNMRMRTKGFHDVEIFFSFPQLLLHASSVSWAELSPLREPGAYPGSTFGPSIVFSHTVPTDKFSTLPLTNPQKLKHKRGKSEPAIPKIPQI